MRKNELLADAMEYIGDDLLTDAKNIQKASPVLRWLPKIAAAAVACAAIIVGSFLLFPHEEVPPAIIDTWQPPAPAENLWQRADFSAFSLLYTDRIQPLSLSFSGGPQVVLLSGNPTTSQPEGALLQAAPIQLPGVSSVKVEAVIGNRYVAYLSENGSPIFYDTHSGVTVDLKQRLLGDSAEDPEILLSLAEAEALKRYPGIFRAEINRAFFRESVLAFMNDRPTPRLEDWALDTTFMSSLEEWQYTAEEDRPEIFTGFCWESYAAALGSEEYPSLQPYRVKFLSVDPQSGKCVVKFLDTVGNNLGVKVYDINLDMCTQEIHRISWNDGTYVRYSTDGSILTVATNFAISSGAGRVVDPDYTERHLYGDTRLGISRYQGEDIYIINSNTLWQGKLFSGAASEGFLSESGKVCYFKKLPEECRNDNFYINSRNWYNRLERYDRDTDQWVFCTALDLDPYGTKILLQGNFVRFMRDETVAVMERGGKYYAYLLKPDTDGTSRIDPYFLYSGIDITQQLQSGQFAVAAHERLQVFLEDGILYRQDLFSGEEKQPIAPADQFSLSSDGAFVFLYKNGSEHAMCYNVVTLESCAIALDPQLQHQLQNTPGAVFRMNYNESTNSLMLSFYLEEDTASSTGIDFLSMLARLEDGSDFYEEPANPTRYTEYTVSQEILEDFRLAVWNDLHHEGGVWYDYKLFPQRFPMFLDRDGLNEALGFSITDDMLDINGTEFLLYEGENEKLTLYFYKFWGFYDYCHHYSGFYFVYEQNGRRFYYQFVQPYLKKQ